jgi:uncharacterized protein YciW
MSADVIATMANAAESPPVAAAMAGRADLMAASQRNCEAVLRPDDPGGLGRAERLALACRIARLNADERLAAHYREAPEADAALVAALADPAAPAPADTRLAAILRHVDLVTRDPKSATRADIAALRDASVNEADIVRLSQLIAFVNYQLRTIAGLRLIGATA